MTRRADVSSAPGPRRVLVATVPVGRGHVLEVSWDLAGPDPVLVLEVRDPRGRVRRLLRVPWREVGRFGAAVVEAVEMQGDVEDDLREPDLGPPDEVRR